MSLQPNQALSDWGNQSHEHRVLCAQACVTIIDALLRRELLRGAWLDLTHVDSKYGMCAKEHLEQVLKKAPAEQESQERKGQKDPEEKDKDKKNDGNGDSGAELIRDMFEKNSIYDNGAAAVRPVGTVLLATASTAAIRVQEHLVTTSGDRLNQWREYGGLVYHTGHYYADLYLDCKITSSYLQPLSKENPAGDHLPLFYMSLGAIVLNILVTITFDDSDETQKGLKYLKDEAQQKSCERWWFKKWPWFRKCLWNILQVRMLKEARQGFIHVSHGYKPSPSMAWIHVSEGLFEATPQSILQTFVVAKLMFFKQQPTWLQLISVMSSTVAIGTAVANIGSNENSAQWKFAFSLYAMTQATLRVWTLCGFTLALQDTGVDSWDHANRTDLTPALSTVTFVLLSLAACFVSARLKVRTRVRQCCCAS